MWKGSGSTRTRATRRSRSTGAGWWRMRSIRTNGRICLRRPRRWRQRRCCSPCSRACWRCVWISSTRCGPTSTRRPGGARAWIYRRMITRRRRAANLRRRCVARGMPPSIRSWSTPRGRSRQDSCRDHTVRASSTASRERFVQLYLDMTLRYLDQEVDWTGFVKSFNVAWR